MFTIALAYGTGLAAFLALDAVWLTLMAPRVYRPAMGDMLMESFAPGPAVIFYALYGVGLAVFATLPALADGRVMTALMRGLLFGLVAYGTYDLTNQATLRNWPLVVTVVDMAWGAIASGLAAAVAVLICSRLIVSS